MGGLPYYPIVCREHSQGAVFHKPLSHQVKYEHKVVEVGSEEYNQIDEKLARLRRVMRWASLLTVMYANKTEHQNLVN